MNRSSLMVSVLVVVFIALCVNVTITLKNTADITAHFNVVCQEHKALARIAKEEVEELIDSNQRFLRPNVNIPGLTHKELVESSEDKIRNKTRNVVELQQISQETC